MSRRGGACPSRITSRLGPGGIVMEGREVRLGESWEMWEICEDVGDWGWGAKSAGKCRKKILNTQKKSFFIKLNYGVPECSRTLIFMFRDVFLGFIVPRSRLVDHLGVVGAHRGEESRCGGGVPKVPKNVEKILNTQKNSF